MRNLHLLRMGCFIWGLLRFCWDKKSEYWRSKHSDKCFSYVTQMEDPNGDVGVGQSRDLMAVVGDALKTNIMTLGSFVLHVSEQLLFFATLVRKTALKMTLKPYIADFELDFEHFCVLACRSAVMYKLEKSLRLFKCHTEPSRMALYRFGNISRSSLWQELAYAEAEGRIKKGGEPWIDEIHQFPVEVPNISTIIYGFF